MKAIMAERLSHRSLFFYLRIILVFAASVIVWLPLAKAQQVGLPRGSDADHKRLLQIRAEAQQAQRDAQIAALRRTAAQSTEKSNRDIVLEQARLDKEFKRRATLAVQQQQAADAYRKIKQSEIDSWNGKGKNRVSPGVPANFTASLPPLEKESRKKKGLFGGVASLRPDFLSRKKKKEKKATMPVMQFAPPESLTLDGVVPRTPESIAETKPEPVEQPVKRGFRIPLVSNLTGGKKKNENPYSDEIGSTSEADSTEPQQTWRDAYPEEGDVTTEKKGFFSRIGNKNKSEDPDAYYGPGGIGNTDETDEMIDEPKSGFLSKLSLKKNKPSDIQDVGSGAEPETSNSRTDIYVVDSSKAQFFPFGKSGNQTDSQGLGEGTLVRMTKSGDDWSSIELSSGTMGVIRNKHLRRAKASEVPGNMFAHKAKTPYPTTARISKPRSATGKGSKHHYSEPVNVPLPDLPVGGSDSGALIGNGLLPPLEQNSTIQ